MRRDEIVMQAIEAFQKAHPDSVADVSVLAAWMSVHLADRIVAMEQENARLRESRSLRLQAVEDLAAARADKVMALEEQLGVLRVAVKDVLDMLAGSSPNQITDRLKGLT